MLKRTLLTLVAATLVATPFITLAARLVQSPLKELTRSHVRIMEARAADETTDGRVVFERVANLSGTSDARTAIRMDAETRAAVESGDLYIVAYTSVMNHPRRREEKLIDPDGPKIMELRGFATTALFESNNDVRFLFSTAGADTTPKHDKAVVAALVRQLQRPDVRTRTLVAGELFLREDLRPSIDRKQSRRIGNAIDDPQLNDELKSYLVETLASLPQERTGEWLYDAVRNIIDHAGVDYDLASHRPRLVSESVQALLPGASSKDRARMVPLLRSNAPRVVESAIAILERLDPAQAAQTVSETLENAQWDDSLTAPSRRILEAYLVEAVTAPHPSPNPSD